MSEKAALSEEDLILLDTLIYSDKLFRDEEYNKTIGNILSEHAADVKAQTPAMVVGSDSWASAVDAAAAPGSAVGGLTVSDHYFNKDTGAEMVCLVDSGGQAYAIFRGTGGGEWSTDLQGVTSAGTFAQLEAWAWFSKLPYDNIIVSGHSNGGNKAMYVTMMAAHNGRPDMVASCLALDAQGFSTRFMQDHLDAAKASGWKIHFLGNADDFVGPLLHSPALSRQYVSGGSQTNIPHAIDALFHFEDGALRLNPGAAQSKAMEFLNGFSTHLTEAQGLEKIDVEVMASALGQLLNLAIGGQINPANIASSPARFILGIGPLLRNTALYIAQMKLTDHNAYMNYQHAMVSYLRDLTGNAELACALWGLLEGGRLDSAAGAYAIERMTTTAYKERDFTTNTINAVLEDMERIKYTGEAWRPGYSYDWHRGQWIAEGVMSETYRWAAMGKERLDAIFNDVCNTDIKFGAQVDEVTDRVASLKSTIVELSDGIMKH